MVASYGLADSGCRFLVRRDQLICESGTWSLPRKVGLQIGANGHQWRPLNWLVLTWTLGHGTTLGVGCALSCRGELLMGYPEVRVMAIPVSDAGHRCVVACRAAHATVDHDEFRGLLDVDVIGASGDGGYR